MRPRSTATARRLLLDPRDIGPIRLLGVGFSGLSDVRQESLFPDLEQQEAELSDTHVPVPEPVPEAGGWRVGDDVRHPEFGHGWVQGAGHGVVSVRFETRASGPGVMRTFHVDVVDLVTAPTPSTAWTGREYVDELARLSPSGRRRRPTGSPAASAAISSTRAWTARSRGTITAPASTRSCPGP